jgi:hypothetical protein
MLRLGEVVRKHRILLKPHFMDKVLYLIICFILKFIIIIKIKG